MKLKYGKEYVDIKLNDKFDILNIEDPKTNISDEMFKEKLLTFLEGKTLNLGTVGVVLADKTRACDYKKYLPILIDTLKSFGAKDENIIFYIAYGTHSQQSDSESLQLYGNTFNNYKFIHHDCNNREDFYFFGTTPKGTEIAYRKDFFDSTFKITFGALSHHYFAGFGGGRKLLFPGLGYRNSIYNNHALFLDKKDKKLQINCQPGLLKNNPLADDLREATSKIDVDLSIHGILNSKGSVSDLILGTNYTDFENACEIYKKTTAFKVDKKYDLVIGSSGGYPKDINLIQMHKSIHYASMFVKDGGELYLIGECRDQVGSKTFLPWFKENSFENSFDKLSDQYSGNGGTALSLMTKLRRISIYLITDLSDDICRKIGVIKSNPTELNNLNINEKETLIIPNASMTVKDIT